MISVCIATHNGEKYIKKQITSILCQLDKDDEIVVSDDGSTDKTLDIIGSISDKRIKVYLFTQPYKTKHTHEYVCRNFENALKQAEGDYIFLSDQDDEWLPNKVEVCMKDLEKHDLVLHNFIHVDDNNNVLKPLHYNDSFRPRNYFMRRGKHYGCAMAFRRHVLEFVLPFPRHLVLHDFWIGILSETLGNFYFENEPLLNYRIHNQNSSGVKNSFIFKISYRLYIGFSLFKRLILYKMGYRYETL